MAGGIGATGMTVAMTSSNFMPGSGGRRGSSGAASVTPSEFTDEGGSYFRRRLQDYQGSRGQVLISKVLASSEFDFLIGLVIVLNSINIAVEQSLRLHNNNTALVDSFEHIFLSVYIVEIGMRFYVGGLGCLKDTWIVFDLVLVISGLATHWVMPFFENSDDNDLGPLMVLRMGRLLRLARTLRLLTKFQVLWMLVRGLMNSVNTMCYTLFLLFLLFFIFGCISMELIRNHELVVGDSPDAEFSDLVLTYFPDLLQAMLTLLQFVTFDNIVLVYRPLVEKDVFLLFFFIPVILIIGIVVMNLVTAVIVQGAFEQAIQDKDLMSAIEDKKRKSMVRKLKVLFRRLDKDNSGYLSREEIAAISNDDKALLSNIMQGNDPFEVFDALDLDKTGDIGIDEFVEGLRQVAISNTPIHMKKMEKQIDILSEKLKTLQQLQMGTQEALGQLLLEVRGRGPGALRPANLASAASSVGQQVQERGIDTSVGFGSNGTRSMPSTKGREAELKNALQEVCASYFSRPMRRASFSEEVAFLGPAPPPPEIAELRSQENSSSLASPLSSPPGSPAQSRPTSQKLGEAMLLPPAGIVVPPKDLDVLVLEEGKDDNMWEFDDQCCSEAPPSEKEPPTPSSISRGILRSPNQPAIVILGPPPGTKSESSLGGASVEHPLWKRLPNALRRPLGYIAKKLQDDPY